MQVQLGLGGTDHGPDILDTGKNRRKLDKIGIGFLSHDAGQGGLAASRRPPENHGEDAIIFDGTSNQGPRSGNPLLAHHLVKGLRSHPFRQGSGGGGGFLRAVFEKVHYLFLRPFFERRVSFFLRLPKSIAPVRWRNINLIGVLSSPAPALILFVRYRRYEK